jgi:hypothetical protein
MQKTELDDIRAVIRRIRDQRHPGLDLNFLNDVLDAVIDSGEDHALAQRRIKEAADAALSRAGKH